MWIRHLLDVIGQLTEVRESGWTLLCHGSEQRDGVREGGAGAYVKVTTVEGVCFQERHSIHVNIRVWSWFVLYYT